MLRKTILIAALLLASPAVAADPKPRKWCGWYMRQLYNVTDRSYNLARKWLHFGSDAGGPCVGCIVVWPHHVGRIEGQTATGWLVHSGNDGRRVRTRERSLKGAIGYRRP